MTIKTETLGPGRQTVAGAPPSQGADPGRRHRHPSTTGRDDGSRPAVAALLGLHAAAARLQVKESFIRRLVAERRIPYYKVGRYLRFDPDDLDNFVLRSRVASRIQP